VRSGSLHALLTPPCANCERFSAIEHPDALAHGSYSDGILKLIWMKNPPHLKVLEAVGMHGAGGEGERDPLQTRMRTTMSMLNSISDFSSTPIAIRKSIRVFARGLFRAVNNAVAVIIAQREYQANLAILRSLTDRELRDIGLDRGRIGAGMAEAARDRALNQLRLTRR
jgi:uncharacterized protein YjiS (DUF1127 family)